MLFSSEYQGGVVQILVLLGYVFPVVYLGSKPGTVSLWPSKPIKVDRPRPPLLLCFFSQELVLGGSSWPCIFFSFFLHLLMVFS